MDTPPTSDLEVCGLEADLCRALADATRLRIVRALAAGPLSVSDLCEVLCVGQPTASRHLKVLRERSLVVASRRGRFVEYGLVDRGVLDALDAIRGLLAGSLSRQTDVLKGMAEAGR